ncbi:MULTISPECIES: ATP-grasp domain-containing protein [Alicyclobacillus]|uniref:Phosphoribosylglycinamide synthetase n=2 Tax=Alicyclobacillus TaxID=29330 RepID=C8WY96_ALIAD|nr:MULTISPECIES: ATP-grasp domain-containing protein [Alicyclobacillus]ACV59990.1 phosphoribosylglycinamide synthetase [Alicyclobacillus acidocaldarius subsp. acidocaldarius DSM 446]
MNEKPQAVVVIGTREHEGEVELVRALGYRVLLLNTKINIEDALVADVPVELDLNDETLVISKVIDLTNHYYIKAVFTLNEYRVPLSARIAETLGLQRTISYEAAQNCRNKKLTRRTLMRNGIQAMKFATVKTPAEALDVIADMDLPVVVKPANDAGSHLVYRCDTLQEVWEAVEAIAQTPYNWVGQNRDPEILIEEYLVGKEYSVEACTIQGETHILAITEKETTTTNVSVEIGHTVPAILEEEQVSSIHDLVKKALRALGVDNCVTHTEIKLDGNSLRIVEVNARPAGDKIPLLVRAVTGYDLRELALHIALGGQFENAPRHEVLAPVAAIRFLIADKHGVVSYDSRGVLEFEEMKYIEFFTKNGYVVKKTTSNYNRLGYFVVFGKNRDHVETVNRKILSKLNLRISDI